MACKRYIIRLLLATLLSISFSAVAQTRYAGVPATVANSAKEPGDDRVYADAVEEMPRYKGGESALRERLDELVQSEYPREAMEKGIEGRVIVQAVITKEGKVGDVRIVRGEGALLDSAAIKIVKQLDDFIPGKMNGVARNVKYTMPVTFKLPTQK